MVSDNRLLQKHLNHGWVKEVTEEMVDGQLKMVERKNREELLRCRESGNKEVDILFVVDYHLHLK